MRAAKAGQSTLGIPKTVGAEFSAADPGGKLSPKGVAEGVPMKKKKRPQGPRSQFTLQKEGKGR